MTLFFITTDRQKCIAVSAVKEAIQRHTQTAYGRVTYWELRDADDRILGNTDRNPMSMGAITPATGEVILVSVDQTETRPTATEMYVSRQPIVGWRDEGYGIMPVLPENLGHGCRVMFPLSDGSLLEPDIAHWPSVEAMKADVLADAQKSWDKKYKPNSEDIP